MTKRGLIIIYTGNGKGKTTAALGLALRAHGRGLKISMTQFIKGSWKSGEVEASRLLPNFEIESLGRGFVTNSNKTNIEEDRAAARAALHSAEAKIMSKELDVIILDEINCAIDMGLLDISETIRIIKEKPTAVHLVLTGRNAPKELMELADIVTEMKEIKHIFHQGEKARIGIDF